LIPAARHGALACAMTATQCSPAAESTAANAGRDTAPDTPQRRATAHPPNRTAAHAACRSLLVQAARDPADHADVGVVDATEPGATGSRSSRRRILPMLVLGRGSVRNSTTRGIL